MALNFLKALGAVGVCSLFIFGTASKDSPANLIPAKQITIKMHKDTIHNTMEVVNISDID